MNIDVPQNPIDADELEAWLIEIDLVKEKIDKLRTGELTVEQFDRQQRVKEEKKRKDEETKIRVEQQKLEKKREGRDGRGEKRNYSNYCPRCCREYELETLMCLRCNGPTMRQSERESQLMEKVQVYKNDKSKKEENRRKWELWQQTQKMLWKKSSTNYKRWDYFESSSDEDADKGEPILPTNDPQFQAMEKDLNERKKRKTQDLKNAEELKLKGNDYMKKGEYDYAVMKYSQALELVKDIKAIWLNRALAYLKLKKFRKAISDCTKVLDYSECFENGFTASRESCFKAFLRRGTAFKERKDYEQALKDSEQALLLCPSDKEALQLQKDIEALRQHSQQVRELEVNELQPVELDYKIAIQSFVTKFISDVRVTDISDLLKCMRNEPDKTKIYFHEKKGVGRLLEVISLNVMGDLNEPNETLSVRMPCLLLKFYLADNVLYQEEFINQGGVAVIMDKVENLVGLSEGRERSHLYDLIEDYLELFYGMVEDDKIRGMMQQDDKLIYHLYPTLLGPILRVARTEASLAHTFVNLCSNLCYGPSIFKKTLESAYDEVLAHITLIFDFSPEKAKYVDLLIATNNLLSNFLSETSFRNTLIADTHTHQSIFHKIIIQLKKVQLLENMSLCRWIESALAILVNLSYQAKEEAQTLLSELNVGPLLIHHFLLNDQLQPSKQVHRVIASRCLQVLSKLNYAMNKDILRPQEGSSILYLLYPFLQIDRTEKTNDYNSSALRIIMQVFSTASPESRQQLYQDLQNGEQLFQLLDILRGLLMSDLEVVFCNACNSIGHIIDVSPLSPTTPSKNCNPCSFFHQVIPRLITIVRDRTGNFRKNAAILLAKLTKDQQNLQALRNLHGFEILKSVIGPIMQK